MLKSKAKQMGRSNETWTKEAKERSLARLKQNLDKPLSYARKKQLLEEIKDDFPRY